MIRTENLTKRYSNPTLFGWKRQTQSAGKLAVDGLTLEIPTGRITGLLGLNGAGKTTTIKMLTTLLEPTSGRGEVDGLDLVRDAQAIRHRINMIAGGERMLYWRLSGRENLAYFGRLYGLDRATLQARARELLERVGLTEAADTPVERYSKGMKQRLQIARGLINDPEYLFLDEPTLGLDAPIARELRRYVGELARQRGKGVLLTSHYMAEVEELCDYIYVIDQGCHVAAGTPAELKRLTGQMRSLRLSLGALPEGLAAQMRSLVGDGRLDVVGHGDTVVVTLHSLEDLTAPVLAALSRYQVPVLKLEQTEPTLEDAILVLASGAAAPLNRQEEGPGGAGTRTSGRLA